MSGDSEKLKQLIELAWENGFDTGKSYSTYYPRFTNRDEILFDHEFVKALLYSKHPLCKEANCKTPTDFEDTMQSLALSKDRIGYLYGEFFPPTAPL